jgi:hypothetical protein
LSLVLIVVILRLRLGRSSFWPIAFDDLGLDGRLIILALSLLVTLIIFFSVFIFFIIRLAFALTVLLLFIFLVVNHGPLLGLIDVGVRNGGFGALGTRVGGDVDVGKRCGAGFALFGRGN